MGGREGNTKSEEKEYLWTPLSPQQKSFATGYMILCGSVMFC